MEISRWLVTSDVHIITGGKRSPYKLAFEVELVLSLKSKVVQKKSV